MLYDKVTYSFFISKMRITTLIILVFLSSIYLSAQNIEEETKGNAIIGTVVKRIKLYNELIANVI